MTNNIIKFPPLKEIYEGKKAYASQPNLTSHEDWGKVTSFYDLTKDLNHDITEFEELVDIVMLYYSEKNLGQVKRGIKLLEQALVKEEHKFN